MFIETSGKIPDREGWSVKLVDEHGQGMSGYGLYRRDTEIT